jgi:hypothetical protein
MMVFCFILALSISMITFSMGVKLLIKSCKKDLACCPEKIRWSAYLVIISGLFTAVLSLAMGVQILTHHSDFRGNPMMSMGQQISESISKNIKNPRN